MAQTVDCLVTKPFTYKGRRYVKGDTVTMAPLEACGYHRKDLITLSTQPDPKPEPEPEPEPVAVRTRRSYRRRDLTAEVSRDLVADPDVDE